MGNVIDMIFRNENAIAAMIFCASAGIGQILHAVKRWSDGDVDSPLAWLTSGLRRTVGAVIGNIGGMVVFIQTGVLGPMLALPNGWWAIFLFGFMNGFTADSALNKGVRSAWTDAERKEKGVGDGK